MIVYLGFTLVKALNNVLFDAATKRIMGLVDFDFSLIYHPCYEFFTSFHNFGGSTLAEGPLEGEMCKSAIVAKDLARPSSIKGMDKITLVCKLEPLLCPFRLTHPVFVQKKTQEQIAKERAKAEVALMECLAALDSWLLS